MPKKKSVTNNEVANTNIEPLVYAKVYTPEELDALDSFGDDITDDWANVEIPAYTETEELDELITGVNSEIKNSFNNIRPCAVRVRTSGNIFNEENLLAEIDAYIKSTYAGHYKGNYQATEIIIDAGHGLGFTLGNVIKYAKRYGKKDGYNRKDLLKMIHYAILALHVHDVEKE